MKLRTIALLPIITTTFLLLTADICLSQQNRSNQDNSPNYLGVGATTSGLAVYSKFALSDQFSVRPMLLFDDFDEDFNGIAILPVTFDFNFLRSKATPFVGIGAAMRIEFF